MASGLPIINYEKRSALMKALKTLRNGREPIFFFNFDRGALPAIVPGLSTVFASDTKEILYRLLKDADCTKGIDLVPQNAEGL